MMERSRECLLWRMKFHKVEDSTVVQYQLGSEEVIHDGINGGLCFLVESKCERMEVIKTDLLWTHKIDSDFQLI